MIRFTCPTCGKGLRVGADKAGRRVACPACGNQLVIPEPTPEPGLFELEPSGETANPISSPEPVAESFESESGSSSFDPSEPTADPHLIRLLRRVEAGHEQWEQARRTRAGLRKVALGATVVLGLLAAVGLPGMCLLSTLAVGRSVSARGGSQVSVSPAGIAVLIVGMAGLGIAAAGVGFVGHRRLRDDPPPPRELDEAINRLTALHPAAVARWGGADALADPDTVRELLDQLQPERAIPPDEPDVAPPAYLPPDSAEVEEPRPRKRRRDDERPEQPRRDKGDGPPKASPSGLPTLEAAGMWDAIKAGVTKGRGLGPGQQSCPSCNTPLKMPPRAAGRRGICPNCRKVVKFPMSGTAAEICSDVASVLNLDASSATIRHALAHAVAVLHPAAGTGGTLEFLQLKVICDQIRENSNKDVRELLNNIARQAGVPVLLPPTPTVANLEDPQVVAAGTPWKLFQWLTGEFGGCHPKSAFEGEAGHPNHELNSAFFISMNNLHYPDDPCRKHSDAMLANLMEMAKQHAEALSRELERRRELSIHGRRCSSCEGKGWVMLGTPAEQRCVVCGGHGVVRQ